MIGSVAVSERNLSILTTEPKVAADALRAGQLAALPTETVYGLATDATNVGAVRRCFAVKGRPANHPVIVHIPPGDLARWAAQPSGLAQVLIAACWPGPLTVVVRKQSWVSPELTGGQPTVALRCVDHPAFAAVLAELAEMAESSGELSDSGTGTGTRAGQATARAIGLAAPSANLFGQVSPTTAQHVLSGLGEYLDDGDVILDGGPCAVGVESTIVDCSGSAARVLRPGAIGIGEIRRVLTAAGLDPELAQDAVISEGGKSPGRSGNSPIRVPGALRSHYAPKARVRVVTAAELADQPLTAFSTLPELGQVLDHPDTAADAVGAVGLIALAQVQTPPNVTRIAAPADVLEFARGLYAWMRLADDLECTQLLIVLPEGADRAASDTPVAPGGEADGLVAAIMDRVRRAATPDRGPSG